MGTRGRTLSGWLLTGVVAWTVTGWTVAAETPSTGGQFTPSGELAARLDLTHHRFDAVDEPAFSDTFILQDVSLDPATPRRFQEFSGDVSGRFLGALALTARGETDWQRLDRLAAKIIACQRPDGRFGNPDLPFDAASVGRDQMALLWGNGRLLTGLLEYWQVRRNDAALAAARRLGDFLLGVFNACSTPEVIARLRGAAANGYICFTQLNEGLELLARATGEAKYREAARRMLPLMDPAAEGAQHTHGFLTTMRGHLLIHESTGDPTLLDETLSRWREIESGNFVLYNGGVLEYFKHDYNRDEGCSEADLFRLCLQCWQASGETAWLDRAERCLFNALSACQFETGDFGHRCYDHWGYIATPGPGRAWWCCTMHGARALADAARAVVTERGHAIQLNLFTSGTYKGDACELELARVGGQGGAFDFIARYRRVEPAAPVRALRIRRPAWAEAITVTVNDEAITPKVEQGYLEIEGPRKTGDTVRVNVLCRVRMLSRDGNEITDPLPGQAFEGALYVGPWLMAVSATVNPMFHGEPYLDNTIEVTTLPALRNAVTFADETRYPMEAGPRLVVPYRHGGFTESAKVELRPISDQTRYPQTTLTCWHRWEKITTTP
ncbi:MAG TPA: glycoside hydrolase family 127 protein [Candidatus Hydrogenedentes bacterium]|nr:glycoside hydrolase family 127 protein [Candidatus Hydrogenedentota bacterium]HOK88771.1 glycoside hydrolase family 127 protein [Candidatus Hydrogenedentota bacterium]